MREKIREKGKAEAPKTLKMPVFSRVLDLKLDKFRFINPIVPWSKAVCNKGFKQKQESAARAAQPCGAATPEEANARCKRAHPFPPACCIIPRSTSHRAETPRVCTCEPMCRLLRGRIASLSQRGISSRFWANLSKLPVRRKRSRRKALALFAPMPIHSSPQCELPQGFTGFGN